MSHADEAVYTCPCCGAYGTVEAFTSHADAAVCASIMGQMPPPVAAAVERYVRLFAPAKHRMTWKRQRRVLEAIAPLIETQAFKARGREWPAPHAAWVAAINTMLDSRTMDLPLTSHKYLQAILIGIAEKAEADAEQQREAARQRNAQAISANASRANAPDEASVARQTRTALALLTQEARINLERFGTVWSDDDGRAFLKSRNFANAVVERAIGQWRDNMSREV